MDFHSRTSQYGSITRSARFAHLGEPLGRAMGDVLESIRSGAFAAEWSSQKEEGAALLERIKAARATLPLAEWERRVLAVLGSRDVAESG
jgi:ketol-acid reductoisomerase